MTINDYGNGVYFDVPDWVTPEIEYKLLRAKGDLPSDFVLQTIDTTNGLAVYVSTAMFERYDVETKVSIATRLNQLVKEIEETGCPAWIEKS